MAFVKLTQEDKDTLYNRIREKFPEGYDPPRGFPYCNIYVKSYVEYGAYLITSTSPSIENELKLPVKKYNSPEDIISEIEGLLT